MGGSLVKGCRTSEKAQIKATAKAEASNAKWSDVYLSLTERVREGRALQSANGLDIPRRRKAPNKLKVDEPVEPPPVEASTPAEVPVVTSTPTPAPAPQPVNSTTSAGTVSESGPPADPTKVAG